MSTKKIYTCPEIGQSEYDEAGLLCQSVTAEGFVYDPSKNDYEW